jgi:hypothetical protein
MKTQITLKRLAISTAVVFAVSASAVLLNDYAPFSGLFDNAVAASDKAGGHKGQGSGKSTASKGSGQGMAGQGMRQGKKSISDILSAEADEDDGEDSDRPAWAGVPGKEGKPGGGNAGGTTKKGGDYGDIVVMLRDDSGELIVEKDGDNTITYAVAPDGTLITIVNGEIPEGADVQAVEFGRMNIARSPASVLEHSLVEALSKLATIPVYDADGNLTGYTGTLDGTIVYLDPAGRLVVNDATIDSPLENLAIYKELLVSSVDADGNLVLTATSSKDGGSITYTFLVPADDRLDLAASAIAASSDKTGELTIDEIVGISGFLGVADELAALVSYDGDDADTLPDWSYDPLASYPDSLTVWVLVETSPGVWTETQVEINDVVTFTPVTDTSIKDNLDGGIDEFTDAANDAVQVLEYVHDNAIDQ